MRIDEEKLTVSIPFSTYTALKNMHDLLREYDCTMLGQVIFVTTYYAGSVSRVTNSTNAEMCLTNPVLKKVIIGHCGYIKGMMNVLEAMSVEMEKKYTEMVEKMSPDMTDMEIHSQETVSMSMKEYREMTAYTEAYEKSRKKIAWCMERLKMIVEEMREINTGKYVLGHNGRQFSEFCQYVDAYLKDMDSNQKKKNTLTGIDMNTKIRMSYNEVIGQPINMRIEREVAWDPYR